ncbi:UNVERIFIED_CONTAM: hypothetical protein RMT77_014647 [Armadillidium vulgare]
MKSQESKSMWAPPSEKPNHYTYLKEFRVEQCQLFLQHKCTQHRPYTCFHWHFLNQRRRRPIRRRDGTFSYSPDNYCPKFDENTGICPDGDDCSLLHRTAGDTERRYHLRYYKTGMCVHDTDSRGMCVKNGPHCAFAHGVDDVRPPVYDIRELQAMESGEHENSNGIGPNSLDKERNMVNDDPKWQDTTYVLANYKTETCKRPPRLCRQGYACPQYHNSRDRRRPPRKYKYRSTACPNVKHGDEWGEPANCEGGDSCQYCHTRTEQQFHPEIYKSTKCNDIQQNGYCPRGAFCAFAHVEQEMTQMRETAAIENCSGTSLADILQSALPPDNPQTNVSQSSSESINNSSANSNNLTTASPTTNTSSVFSTNSFSDSTKQNYSSILNKTSGSKSSFSALPNKQGNSNAVSQQQIQQQTVLAPIGSKPRHLSGNGSSSTGSANCTSGSPPSITKDMLLNNTVDGFCSSGTNSGSGSLYPKAPGSEREDRDALLRKQWASIESDPTLDPLEKAKRKRSLILASSGVASSSTHTLSSIPPSFNSSMQNTYLSSNVSPLAPPFYPTSDTVQSVIGNALEELNLDESMTLGSSLDRDFESKANTLTNSLSNSLTSSITGSGLIGGSSAPVNIPRSNYHDRNSLQSQSPSSTSSPGFPHSFLLQRENSFEQASSSFLRSAAPGAPAPTNNGGFGENSLFGVSPHHYPLSTGLSQSPLLSNIGGGGMEVQRLRDELLSNRAKLASWEEGIAQARSACQAWKREADEAKGKVQLSEQAREELASKCASQQKELDEIRAGRLGPFVQSLHPQVELGKLPLHTLKALQNQLKRDLMQVEKVINDFSLKNDQWPGVISSW